MTKEAIIQQKILNFSRQFISHQQAGDLLSLMQSSIDCCEMSRNKDGEIDEYFDPTEHSLVMIGLPGLGKTTTCKKIQATNKSEVIQIEGAAITKIPCFYCAVESPPTIKNLAKSMLQALGDPKPDKGNSYDMTTRVKTLLKNCRTNLIMLDEFHHLLTSAKAGESLDWLKRLMDSTRIPIVVCGIPGALALLGTESQMARRFSHEIILTPHKWDKQKNRPGDFGSYITPLITKMIKISEKKMGFIFKSLDFYKRLYVSTSGYPTDIDSLLKNTLRFALMNQNTEILMNDFENAFHKIRLPNYKGNKALNPFNCSEQDLTKLMRNI
jgi:TniB protein